MTADLVFYSVAAEGDIGMPEDISSATVRAQSSRSRARSSALARALLSRMLCGVWGMAPDQVRICSEPSGRPYLAPVLSRSAPFISMSHTRGWVACAATEIGPLGIDIERQKPSRDHAGIAAMAFGPREAARAAGGERAFYRIWTLREAIAKACGQGLTLAADGRDRVHEGPDDGQWLTTLEPDVWSLSHSSINEDISLAIAVLLPEPRQTVSLERWACP